MAAIVTAQKGDTGDRGSPWDTVLYLKEIKLIDHVGPQGLAFPFPTTALGPGLACPFPLLKAQL